MTTAVDREPRTEPCRWPALDAMEENLREVRHAVTNARHAAEEFATDAADGVRRHPFRFLGGAALSGAFVGMLVGFGAAWFARTYRR
jgi:hypothetical protein